MVRILKIRSHHSLIRNELKDYMAKGFRVSGANLTAETPSLKILFMLSHESVLGRIQGYRFDDIEGYDIYSNEDQMEILDRLVKY